MYIIHICALKPHPGIQLKMHYKHAGIYTCVYSCTHTCVLMYIIQICVLTPSRHSTKNVLQTCMWIHMCILMYIHMCSDVCTHPIHAFNLSKLRVPSRCIPTLVIVLSCTWSPPCMYVCIYACMYISYMYESALTMYSNACDSVIVHMVTTLYVCMYICMYVYMLYVWECPHDEFQRLW
jgi:hypothetical protein